MAAARPAGPPPTMATSYGRSADIRDAGYGTRDAGARDSNVLVAQCVPPQTFSGIPCPASRRALRPEQRLKVGSTPQGREDRVRAQAAHVRRLYPCLRHALKPHDRRVERAGEDARASAGQNRLKASLTRGRHPPELGARRVVLLVREQCLAVGEPELPICRPLLQQLREHERRLVKVARTEVGRGGRVELPGADRRLVGGRRRALDELERLLDDLARGGVVVPALEAVLAAVV